MERHLAKRSVSSLPAGAGFGLPALDAEGVPLELPTSLIFFFCIAPSDISPAVTSPSLPEPAVILGRRTVVCDSPGVLGRLPRAAADAFFCFFLVDSLPLDSDKAGEPARFRDFPFFTISESFCLPCGVVDPLAFCNLDLSLASP